MDVGGLVRGWLNVVSGVAGRVDIWSVLVALALNVDTGAGKGFDLLLSWFNLYFFSGEASFSMVM